MMARANRHYTVRGLASVLLLAILAFAGFEVRNFVRAQNQADHAAELVQRLLDADIAQAPAIIREIDGFRNWADPKLREVSAPAEREGDRRRRLHTSLALAPVDPGQAGFLTERLLDADPDEARVIRDALFPPPTELVQRLWAAVEKPEPGREPGRLRAALSLAKYDPANPRWSAVADAVANDLVSVPAVHLGTWLDLLRPVQDSFLPSLTVIFRDGKRPDVVRFLAANILADCAAEKSELLADLLMDADAKSSSV